MVAQGVPAMEPTPERLVLNLLRHLEVGWIAPGTVPGSRCRNAFLRYADAFPGLPGAGAGPASHPDISGLLEAIAEDDVRFTAYAGAGRWHETDGQLRCQYGLVVRVLQALGRAALDPDSRRPARGR